MKNQNEIEKIRKELEIGIKRNNVLPLDWAMDRITPIIEKAIKDKEKEMLDDEISNNINEQEFLNYIFGYFNSNEPTDSHIRLLVKERLENINKRYLVLRELKQKLKGASNEKQKQ